MLDLPVEDGKEEAGAKHDGYYGLSFGGETHGSKIVGWDLSLNM